MFTPTHKVTAINESLYAKVVKDLACSHTGIMPDYEKLKEEETADEKRKWEDECRQM